MYDKFLAKVNNIDTTGFVLKTKYDTDKSDLEKKISYADKKNPNISGLVKKKKNSKHLIQVIIVVKVILKMMVSNNI